MRNLYYLYITVITLRLLSVTIIASLHFKLHRIPGWLRIIRDTKRRCALFSLGRGQALRTDLCLDRSCRDGCNDPVTTPTLA